MKQQLNTYEICILWVFSAYVFNTEFRAQYIKDAPVQCQKLIWLDPNKEEKLFAQWSKDYWDMLSCCQFFAQEDVSIVRSQHFVLVAGNTPFHWMLIGSTDWHAMAASDNSIVAAFAPHLIDVVLRDVVAAAAVVTSHLLCIAMQVLIQVSSCQLTDSSQVITW